MNITLISPRIGIQQNDLLGSGIPYWPIELANLATILKKNNQLDVIDMFGENPNRCEKYKDHYMQGISIKEMISRIDLNTSCVIIFAISYMSHGEILEIVTAIREKFPNLKIGILENSQAVTSYSISIFKDQFDKAGVNFLAIGSPVFLADKFQNRLMELISSSSETEPLSVITNLASDRPRSYQDVIPSWEYFPIQNYWKIPYSHGAKKGKFLPLLTSRGCPYPCDFCVVPNLNSRRWSFEEPDSLIDRIKSLKEAFNINHFQIEDLNPTVDKNRWIKIAQLIIDSNLDITYDFVSGTKAETLSLDHLDIYYQSGLRYFSISPESGSEKLMKVIGKKFDYTHGELLVKKAHSLSIQTQACFIVGHPSESEEDFELSRIYLRRLLKAGLDEVGIFIVAPFAGSKLYQSGSIQVSDYDKFNSFSPRGRYNYKILNKRRNLMLLDYTLYKFTKPIELLRMIYRSFLGVPKTKVENLPRRIFFLAILLRRQNKTM